MSWPMTVMCPTAPIRVRWINRDCWSVRGVTRADGRPSLKKTEKTADREEAVCRRGFAQWCSEQNKSRILFDYRGAIRWPERGGSDYRKVKQRPCVTGRMLTIEKNNMQFLFHLHPNWVEPLQRLAQLWPLCAQLVYVCEDNKRMICPNQGFRGLSGRLVSAPRVDEQWFYLGRSSHVSVRQGGRAWLSYRCE